MSEAVALPPDQAVRVTEFARACKAAARAVALYPPAHPAISVTLARIVDHTSTGSLQHPLRFTVLPDVLLLDGQPPGRVDHAVVELASLLHDHQVGEMTIYPGGDLDAWRSFLLLLARAPESVRTDGGIARLWTTSGGRHVELREIDYAEVLRERAGGESAAWDQLIASCLHGQAFDLTPEAVQALMEIAGNVQRLSELVASVDERAGVTGTIPARAAALVKMLRVIADVVGQENREALDGVLRNMAGAIGQLAPEVMLELLAQRTDEDTDAAALPIVGEVVRRMSDHTIASFVTRNVASQGSSTERIAQAFHALVPEPDRRHRLVGLSHEMAAASPLGRAEGFESLWETVAELLRSYSDESYVPDAYGRELSAARSQAIEVERISDDPPERMAGWLTTVSASAVRALDLTLMLDLLRLEADVVRWRELTMPAVSHIEDLLLVGDFDAADRLATVLVHESGTDGSLERKPIAVAALERLASGPMMRHVISHLPTVDEAQFARITSLCTKFGAMLVRPLAEALSIEERGRTRERLTALLIAFGASGRQTVERLKHSANPAVRRTAVYLLREFGGTDALPDLTALLDDREPQVQREAVRAILNIGSNAAYRELEQALATGSPQSREAIMQTVAMVRDERATPLFSYILDHVDHRGPLRAIYLRAIESLGALGDPDGIAALKSALYRGEWWAPRRTSALRAAAAAALVRIGTADALAVLQEAETAGGRLRAIARPALARASSPK